MHKYLLTTFSCDFNLVYLHVMPMYREGIFNNSYILRYSTVVENIKKYDNMIRHSKVLKQL